MDNNSTVVEQSTAITLDDIALRMDALGNQMNWLCENLQSLFLFVSQVNSNGGGLRGMLSALKHAPPEMKTGGSESTA
jgi:hypothetical protein